MGSAELGMVAASRGAPGIDPEDVGLVTVERKGLAVTLEMGARRGKVSERRFGRDKQKLHQMAGCIIHVDWRVVRSSRSAARHCGSNRSAVAWMTLKRSASRRLTVMVSGRVMSRSSLAERYDISV